MEGGTFGRYRVIKKIATGGMGEVYAAVHEIMEREAVIKFLLPKMSANKTVVRRFFNEALAAARILHPGIVEIFDFGYTDDGRAYIVMEMLRGEPLDRRLEHRPVLPLDQAVRVIRQLAGAVGAAHDKGIVHRDLKPDNIYLVPDPEVQGGERVKVLDFGLAKLAQLIGDSMVTQDGSVFGTPAYMAPEQCRNSAAVDHRADVYSIGCIFYRFVAGRAPFGTGGGVDVLAAQLQAPVRPPSKIQPSIPRHIEAVIMKLLEKDPDERLQSCQALIDALDRKPGAWAGDAVSLPAPGDPQAARNTVQIRKPARVVALPSLSTVRLVVADDDTDRMLAPHLPGVHDKSTMRLDVNHARAAVRPAAAEGGLPGVTTRKGVAAPPAQKAPRQGSEQTMMLDDSELVEIAAPVAGYHPAAPPADPPAAGAAGHDPFAPFASPMGDPFDRPTGDDPRRRSSISAGMGEVFRVPPHRHRRWWPVAVGLAGASTLLAVLLHLLGGARGPGGEARPAKSPPEARETHAEPAAREAAPAREPEETKPQAPPEEPSSSQAVTEAEAVTDEPAPAPETGAGERAGTRAPGGEDGSKDGSKDGSAGGSKDQPMDGPRRLRAIRRATKQSRYRHVLRLCAAGLDQVPERVEAITLCGLAACRTGNAPQARRHHRALPPARQSYLVQTCLKHDVSLASRRP